MTRPTLNLSIFFLMFASSSMVFAEAPSRSGGHFAVTEFKKEEGFKLSEKSIKTLGIEFQTLKEGKTWILPTQALVYLKHTSGVYRRYDGWITYVIVKILKKNGAEALIASDDLEPGDEVATQGTSFLRMAEVDLNTDTIDGCAH